MRQYCLMSLDNTLTRLDTYNSCTSTSVLLSRKPSSSYSLDADCGLLPPHVLRQSLRQDNFPPALNLDRLGLQISVPAQLDPSPDVLLHDRDELVESGCS
jgi:hypothetical protein